MSWYISGEVHTDTVFSLHSRTHLQHIHMCPIIGVHHDRRIGNDSKPQLIDFSLLHSHTRSCQPLPFADAVSVALKAHAATGVNLDLEPCQTPHNDCSAEDGNAYALFLSTFADALHAHGFTVTVDIASWSPFWNFTAIAGAILWNAVIVGG
jgi:hypothetical protein